MGYYVVPGMTLISQKLNMSCWYASTEMLIKWRMDQSQQSFAWLIPPEYDADCIRIRDSNNGIQNPQIVPMAKRLGLQAVPPLSPMIETVEDWLRTYGPLWVNGKNHIVVIAGVNTAANLVKVYDPWPPNVGGIDWRDYTNWYAMGSSASTRDTGRDVETVFLYVPE